eukprot:m.1352410 g.1352410  ORF g.1352410 m.1352410 type:complete len:68 (-) comp24924_c0_seq7:1148-1351(-)
MYRPDVSPGTPCARMQHIRLCILWSLPAKTVFILSFNGCAQYNCRRVFIHIGCVEFRASGGDEDSIS